MDWIKAHYDRVLVIAAAVFLLFTSILIWRNASAFGDKLVSPFAISPPIGDGPV